MKVGEKVRYIYNKREGVSQGPIFHFGVWWILVEWDDGSRAMVLERTLETINESR